MKSYENVNVDACDTCSLSATAGFGWGDVKAFYVHVYNSSGTCITSSYGKKLYTNKNYIWDGKGFCEI